MNSETVQPVFVYGTLRRGGSNAFRMEGAEWLGAGTVRGRLYRISWYPGLVPDGDADLVAGDVHLVPDGMLAALDEFEGLAAGEIEGSEYRRVKVSADLDGHAVEVWVYAWKGPVDESQRIAGGDWLLAESGE